MSIKSEAKKWWKDLPVNEQIRQVEDWKKITKSPKKKTSVVLIASDDSLLELVYTELFKTKK